MDTRGSSSLIRSPNTPPPPPANGVVLSLLPWTETPHSLGEEPAMTDCLEGDTSPSRPSGREQHCRLAVACVRVGTGNLHLHLTGGRSPWSAGVGLLLDMLLGENIKMSLCTLTALSLHSILTALCVETESVDTHSRKDALPQAYGETRDTDHTASAPRAREIALTTLSNVGCLIPHASQSRCLVRAS
ncbi:hypothetical protein P4O66_000771 [Electrophorus voltai]|uniref:Uncharacterized protein n=1 Tax=Electrophorus voltai TaxID=2609070 RepID=A0AAD8ZDS9_9TELE|nr:hypothetical protein P4O66_000771 [Electrophorus voltai]